MHFIGENWEMIKQTIHTEYDLTNISYNTWIEPLQFYDVKDDTVYIQIPTGQAHALNYISNKYSNYFKVTISEMMDHDYDISFILEKEKAADTDTDLKSPSSNINNINYEQANLNPKYKFDTFIVGNNNKFAHSACLAVAESPGNAYNPLFIYGGAGLGKTHLMHSIGHFILEQNPNMKVLYVTSESFTNEVIESIRSGNATAMTKLREKYRTVDVLMIDDIHTDKIALRASIAASLERLLSQNYISRNGDTYAFLTDEEQDIAIDIKNTPVDSAQIVQSISQTVYGEIYPAKKYKYGKYDFAYDQYVDETLNGASTGGMRLRIVTVASDLHDAGNQRLIMDSQVNNEAVVVLSENTPYFDELEQAMKIRKYVKQRNVSQMPESIQRIIRDRNDEARKLESHARSLIEKAIVEGKFYVHGEILDLKYGSAKDKLDEAMKSLVESVYSKLNMVNQFVDSDADILAILNGAYEEVGFTGLGANNEDALNEISQWLELQNQKMLKTSMGDVQRRYQAIPYGWKEIDIAALIARLIVQQKIQINYGGAVVGKEERRLVDFLRKKTEIDKAIVARRIAPSEELIRKGVNFLRDYLGAMDIPSDEDGLIRFVLNTFETKQSHYQKLLDEFYSKERYPEKETVTAARDLMNDVLSQRKDNVALLKRMVQRQDDLLDSAEDMEGVEMFFKAQRTVFDDAKKRLASILKERDYFAADADTLNVISTMSTILAIPKPYSRIGELPELVQKVKTAYDSLLDMKREEVAENIRQCMQDVHQLASEARDAGALLRQADDHFVNKREAVKTATSLTELDAMITQLLNYKDTICRRMEVMTASRQQEAQKPTPAAPAKPGTPAPKPPKIMTVRRYDLCSVKRLQNKEDIDKYVEVIREKLMKTLESCDGVQIN
jgi:DNA replication protein DnaC